MRLDIVLILSFSMQSVRVRMVQNVSISFLRYVCCVVSALRCASGNKGPLAASNLLSSISEEEKIPIPMLTAVF